MEKTGPTIGKLAVAVAFALSCFGLLLFLWVTFGGPVPLTAQSYRVTAYFPEATQLAAESDVRISGVSVGKVKSVELAETGVRLNGRDVAATEIEIEPEFAPIPLQTRAILRQKTLLGETYVELAPGTGEEDVPDGGSLGLGAVEEATQVDEIFDAVDPRTRRFARQWVAGTAQTVSGRGLDLNDALGNLGPFLEDAETVTRIVRAQRTQVGRLIRNTGTVLDAVSRDEAALQGAVTGTEAALGGLADAGDPLSETIVILPTFEREAALTLARLDDLQRSARPVIDSLLPVADQVPPTLRSLRKLAPPLERLFGDVAPLVAAAETGLPATDRLLEELRPALGELEPVVANLNPVIRYLYAYRNIVTAFLSGPPLGVTGTLPEQPGQPAPRHFLRILPYLSQESLGVYPVRLATNRGNAYVQPRGYLEHPTELAFESFDCKNTDYSPESQDPDEEERRLRDGRSPEVGVNFAPCIAADDFTQKYGGVSTPLVTADD